jgi:hypothetical protein
LVIADSQGFLRTCKRIAHIATLGLIAATTRMVYAVGKANNLCLRLKRLGASSKYNLDIVTSLPKKRKALILMDKVFVLIWGLLMAPLIHLCYNDETNRLHGVYK